MCVGVMIHHHGYLSKMLLNLQLTRIGWRRDRSNKEGKREGVKTNRGHRFTLYTTDKGDVMV